MRSRTKILLALLGALVGLGGALAGRLHTWGRPLPIAYQRLAVTPAGSQGGRSATYLRTGAGPQAAGSIVTVDADGDGTIDLVQAEGRSSGSFARPRPDDPEARWLVICLDGVPYGELKALWEEGYFREFFRPAPVISTFPSDSESALTDAFHAEPVPGYEHRYFDRARNELAGGALATLTGNNIPYLRRLDYDMPGQFKGLTYVLPRRSYRADLGRFRQRFLASRKKVFLAHIASSDSLYHILPRGEMRRLLIEVDDLLRELYFEAGGKLRITVFSDHGNSLVASRPVPLAKHLAADGWRLSASLLGPRDVAVPAYGLVGFLAVYCAMNQREELAEDLAHMEGVDLVVYAETNGVTILSPRGRARLRWNEQVTAFHYELLTGDPLALAAILAKLKQEGKTDADGWVKDADLFAATQQHLSPDPAYRLWQWATNHVRNRADILVSLKPGYYYGSGTFQHLVDILSTHGSLDRDQSLGFAMSTDAPLAGPLRSRDLLSANLAGPSSPQEAAGRQKSEKRK